MSSIIIGIDLGTTNSMGAWVSETGAEIIENPSETTQTPSVVTLRKEGILVGTEAKSKRMQYPHNTFYSFKRFMGRGAEDVHEDLSKLPFEVSKGERDNLLLAANGIELSPEQMSAQILQHIKKKSEIILGQEIKKTVITVPAYFDDGQRQATRDAAEIAGLDVVRIINEPTAAAIAYGLDEKKKGKIAVFDFGGGTFDVSILELKDKIFKVLSTHGNTHLGGDDIDHNVAEMLTGKVFSAEQKESKLTPQTRQYLKHIAEEIKIELTTSLEVTKKIEMPWLDIETKFTVTREEFDQAIGAIVEETLDHVKLALKDAGLTGADIEEVVMVGGSTRIPLVRKKVGDFFNLSPHVRINPDQVVAIGAGIQGHLLAGGRRDFLLMDVIPLSLGIETLGGTFSKLIIKNASIPAKATEIFSTSADNQTGVVIGIYQGEREFIKDCRFLGKFILKGIPPMPAGLPQVEVTFFVDANGLLTVSAKERRSGVETQIEIIPSHGLKRSEVNRIISDSMEYAIDDFNTRNFVEFKNTATRVLEGIEKIWPQAGEILSPEQMRAIENHKPILAAAMKSGDPVVLKTAIDEMGELTRDLADSVMGQAIKNALVGEKKITMKKLSGTEISNQIREELKTEVSNLKKKNIEPCLAVILVGDDPASAVYVRNKQKACEKLGIRSIEKILPATTTQETLLATIKSLNDDSSVHGILCQLPLPKGLDESEVIHTISPDKDVDCFHPYNFGLLAAGEPRFMPCTPFGVLQILKREGIETKGKEVAIIGRSNIVGRPLSILLSLKGYDSTVTICHSGTKNLKEVCLRADIIVAAIGRPEFVTADYLKQDAVVIDVGINRIEDQSAPKGTRLVGDADFNSISQKASAATPVPGGVGPMTITMLLYNTINAARFQAKMERFEL